MGLTGFGNETQLLKIDEGATESHAWFSQQGLSLVSVCIVSRTAWELK